MYALQTVGSTTSSVKDDSEVLELDDAGNSIVEQIVATSNAYKQSGNLTANGFKPQSHPALYDHDRKNGDDDGSIGLCFWTIFQAVGLTCVTTIICRSIIYRNGYFETTSENNTTSITKEQFSNWHYSLTTFGFIYLYANSIFMIRRSKKSSVTLTYIMLHTFAYIVSALGLYAMYVHKESGKPKHSKFYEDHVFSIHSWTGVLAAAMFTAQWLSAVFAFMMPCLYNLGLPLGKMFSLYTVLVSTICLISGINHHAMHSLKEQYRQYSTESLVLNGFGMMVMVFLFLIAHTVIKTNKY